MNSTVLSPTSSSVDPSSSSVVLSMSMILYSLSYLFCEMFWQATEKHEVSTVREVLPVVGTEPIGTPSSE